MAEKSQLEVEGNGLRSFSRKEPRLRRAKTCAARLTIAMKKGPPPERRPNPISATTSALTSRLLPRQPWHTCGGSGFHAAGRIHPAAWLARERTVASRTDFPRECRPLWVERVSKLLPAGATITRQLAGVVFWGEKSFPWHPLIDRPFLQILPHLFVGGKRHQEKPIRPPVHPVRRGPCAEVTTASP